MERLYLEITPSPALSFEVFLKLIRVPAKRLKLNGALRNLNDDNTLIAITVEGPEEDVGDFYTYMFLCDHVVGSVKKAKESEIEEYTELEPFHVELSRAADLQEEAIGVREQHGHQEVRRSEHHGEGASDEAANRKPVGLTGVCDSGQDEVRVVPETPEKDLPPESEDEACEEAASPEREDSQSTYVEDEESRSPVFKGGRPQKRGEPVGFQATRDMFESEGEEESQSIISMAKRNRKRVCKRLE